MPSERLRFQPRGLERLGFHRSQALPGNDETRSGYTCVYTVAYEERGFDFLPFPFRLCITRIFLNITSNHKPQLWSSTRSLSSVRVTWVDPEQLIYKLSLSFFNGNQLLDISQKTVSYTTIF